jgi:hypothetical protein
LSGLVTCVADGLEARANAWKMAPRNTRPSGPEVRRQIADAQTAVRIARETRQAAAGRDGVAEGGQ